MRIVSVRVGAVARIFAIIYVALSPVVLLAMALTDVERINLPIGVVSPLASLYVYLTVPRPTHIATILMLIAGMAFCCLITGWLTGAVAAVIFNFVARRIGGIEVSVLTDDPVRREPTVEPIPR